MNTTGPTRFPDYELEVQLAVLPEQIITVNGAETELPNLKVNLERAISGKRARVNVDVLPPEGRSDEFIDFVRRVQAQIRQVGGAVMFAYRTVSPEDRRERSAA